MDFQVNKRIINEVAMIQTKRLRNKIAGFTTHLMRRIQKGPVRGISFKLQEEERERKDNYVPTESALRLGHIEVDPETMNMLETLKMNKIGGLVLKEERAEDNIPSMNNRRERRVRN